MVRSLLGTRGKKVSDPFCREPALRVLRTKGGEHLFSARFLPAIVIFGISFAMRWPSCGESFWVDELHTAWTIGGHWSDVVARAAIGNQQSAYFDVLWLWQHFSPTSLVEFYGIEAWLRLTSVLLTSIAAVIVFQAVNSMSGGQRVVGGIVAGLMLALDLNCIFYGTELRPYAVIILMSALSMGVALPRGREVQASDRWMLHSMVLAAAWIHITSTITLGWLLAAVILSDLAMTVQRRQTTGLLLKKHLLPMLLWIVFGLIWCSQNSELWNSRSNWQSFGKAKSLNQVWSLWNWTPMLILPGVFWVGNVFRGSGESRHRREMCLLGITIIGSTMTGYLISKYAGIPVWHRRYYVAGLPIIATLMGLLVDSNSTSVITHDGVVEHSFPSGTRQRIVNLMSREALAAGIRTANRRLALRRSQLLQAKTNESTSRQEFRWRWSKVLTTSATSFWRSSGFFSVGVSILCLALLLWQQGTFTRLVNGSGRLVHRGEDWRGAAAFIRERKQGNEPVWVDANLIEQSKFRAFVNQPRYEEYFRFSLDGPYLVGDAIGVGSNAFDEWKRSGSRNEFGKGDRFYVTRGRRFSSTEMPANVEKHAFGSVSVLIQQSSH